MSRPVTAFHGVQFLSNGGPVPVRLSDRDYEDAARALEVDEATIRAVVEVESSGQGFGRRTRVKARFEAHKFSAFTGGRYDDSHPHISAARYAPEVAPAPPDGVFFLIDAASQLDEEAALKATSWGLFQIMGFNHHDAGYDRVRDMVEDFRTGEPAHLRAFVNLLESWRISALLRSHDWDSFARRYNGPAYRRLGYHTKLREAYRRHSKGVPSYRVLRLGDQGAAVYRLQERLNEHGHNLVNTGVFDRYTEIEVKAFQASEGLVVDGIVGRVTWTALAVEPTGEVANTPSLADRAEEAGAAPALAATGVLGGVVQILEAGGAQVARYVPPWALAALVIGVGLVVLWRMYWRR